MATWTTIPDSSLEPGKPIRSIDALALRDNPVAIAEGQSGAPRVVDAALGTTATNTGRDWVLARHALTQHAVVGSITVAWNATTTNVESNGTIAGGDLRYTNAAVASQSAPADVFQPITNENSTFPISGTTTLPGTWRNIGPYCRGRYSFGNDPTISVWYPSLWLRIA